MPTVTFRSLIEVGLSPRGLYSLGLGTLLGSGVWVTFIAGIIMFKTLPRQQFGNVQKKVRSSSLSLTRSLLTIRHGSSFLPTTPLAPP